MTASDWTRDNQRLIVLELRRLVARLHGGDAAGERALDGQIDAAKHMNPPAAIDVITAAFGLSDFERSLLLLCAGAELDATVTEAVAALGRGSRVTYSLALSALGNAHWSALSLTRPLRRWRMIEPAPGHDLASAPLRIDERTLHFLAGVNYLDPRLQPLLSRGKASPVMASEHREIAERIALRWIRQQKLGSVIQLSGNDPPGAEDIAVVVANQFGLQLQILAAENLPGTPNELEEFAALWSREAILLPAVLLVQCGGNPAPPQVARLADRLNAPLFIAGSEPLCLSRSVLQFDVYRAGPNEQKSLWRQALDGEAEACDEALESIASQFQLSAQTIARAAAAARDRIDAGEAPSSALRNACRMTGRRRLDDLAVRIAEQATWDDLVLPPTHLELLRHIVVQVRQRRRVYDEWGFARNNTRGLGVAVLFSGESGTGKTLAAEVLACELGLDLYRIDLSSVVSKYIGETEKNLRRVFDAAEDSGAILLFDEADALFGKRSEVKDSHDRYANIEISYLLQRMEAYRGLAILTTNLKNALDTAFQRRLRFIVHFPFPDIQQREAIWRRAFPVGAPLENLDFGKLARLNVPGGGVRNISLNAAFLAAEEGGRLGMRHLLRAAQADRAKVERPLSDMETRGWA